MTRIAVVPGSFDPVTLGHVDLIRRAAALFDVVHAVVVHNPGKAGFFSIPERRALLEQAVAGVPGEVVVAGWSSGLLVDYCRRVGASALVKGVRSAEDVTYETPMALMNRDLADVETVLLVADPPTAHVSSSLVREVARLGGDVARFVPPAVLDALRAAGAPDA